MNAQKLQEGFVAELHKRMPRRSKLVNVISDILHIENESASRRLSGKVPFTASELSILAEEFNISIDRIVHGDSGYQWMPLILEPPMGAKSMQSLFSIIENNLAQMDEVTQMPAEYGILFSSLPLEFYVNFDQLSKFMLFKWGYYCINSEEFNDFSRWKVPGKLVEIKERMKQIIPRFDTILYIWDSSLIWTLMGEVEYFHKMHIISSGEMEDIKNELKELLKQLELFLKGTLKSEMYNNITLYVSSINIGITSYYLSSEEKQLSSVNSNFLFSMSNDDPEKHKRIRNWIESFRNISTLISGSGGAERRLFFKRQDKIINEYYLCS